MLSQTGYVMAIQCDWNETLRNNESVWVYHKFRGQRSDHGTIGDRNGGDKFTLLAQENNMITIRHNPTGHQRKFLAPVTTYNSIHKKGIVCINVANGGLGVSVCSNNKLLVWETATGNIRRELEGHLFDVYTSRIFPSGVVVLSGGADMQLRIWDAATGTCAVVLKGHTGTVMDSAIVDRGRNIISVSKDKTTRLWNCANATCIDILHTADSEVNCCDITDVSSDVHLAPTLEEKSDLEYCTAGKVVVIGCESGSVYIIDVSSRTVLNNVLFSSAVMAVKWITSIEAVVGLADGQLHKVNVKKPNASERLSHDSDSCIQCIEIIEDNLMIGRHDGLCQLYSFNGSPLCHLTGPDCDPVYSISQDDNHVFTASRDAQIRKYSKRDLL